jgi:hypothetical protein
MQGAQAARFNFTSAALAGPIESAIESLKGFLDRRQFVPGRIVDRLQRLVILQLNGAVAGIPDQRFILTLQVADDPLVSLLEKAASSRQELLDPAGMILCYRHLLFLVCLGCARKIT